jgi:alkanesulfonate monooxygenase
VTNPKRSPLDIAWFGALCDDDAEFLGEPAPALASSWEHCSELVRTVDGLGFDSVLLPSGYELGIDTVAFAAAIAPQLRGLSPLVAVRCGEVWLPTLARQLGTLDQILAGRLRVNIISSDLPGQSMSSEERYARTLATMRGLRTLMGGGRLNLTADLTAGLVADEVNAPRILRNAPRVPPLYFGGLSPAAREVAAQEADVYLMWPDTVDGAAAVVTDLTDRADRWGRQLRFGYRTHVVVRETEAEARAAAAALVSKLDDAHGASIRSRSLDAASFGVNQQSGLRSIADADGYVGRHLWTGVGRARSGCGAAIVGDPHQVAAELRAYAEVGMDSFILSGYPHIQEAERFATLVLPLLRGR